MRPLLYIIIQVANLYGQALDEQNLAYQQKNLKPSFFPGQDQCNESDIMKKVGTPDMSLYPPYVFFYLQISISKLCHPPCHRIFSEISF